MNVGHERRRKIWVREKRSLRVEGFPLCLLWPGECLHCVEVGECIPWHWALWIKLSDPAQPTCFLPGVLQRAVWYCGQDSAASSTFSFHSTAFLVFLNQSCLNTTWALCDWHGFSLVLWAPLLIEAPQPWIFWENLSNSPLCLFLCPYSEP